MRSSLLVSVGCYSPVVRIDQLLHEVTICRAWGLCHEYMPTDMFLKRMSNSVSHMNSKCGKDTYGKCKMNIVYLETVLVFASNSNDAAHAKL